MSFFIKNSYIQPSHGLVVKGGESDQGQVSGSIPAYFREV